MFRKYQIVYCDPIIEMNNRYSLSELFGSNELQNGQKAGNLLHSFFPFDPYILKRSSIFIQPIYIEYRDDGEESASSKDPYDQDVREFLSYRSLKLIFVFD